MSPADLGLLHRGALDTGHARAYPQRLAVWTVGQA